VVRALSSDVWKTHLKVSRVTDTLMLEWDGIGCKYNTPTGVKTVLEVRPWRGDWRGVALRQAAAENRAEPLQQLAHQTVSTATTATTNHPTNHPTKQTAPTPNCRT